MFEIIVINFVILVRCYMAFRSNMYKNKMKQRKIPKYCVYITTNKKNNMRYIGKATIARHKAGYLGSGINLRSAVDTYGKKMFTSKILSTHKTEKMAYKSEMKAIAKYNAVKDPMYYNITAGGDGYGFENGIPIVKQKNIRKAIIGIILLIL